MTTLHLGNIVQESKDYLNISNESVETEAEGPDSHQVTNGEDNTGNDSRPGGCAEGSRFIWLVN